MACRGSRVGSWLAVLTALAAPAAAQPFGPIVALDELSSVFGEEPAATVFPAGGVLAVWTSTESVGDDDSQRSVQGRRFAADLTPEESQFQVNTTTASSQHEPAVGSDANGNAIVVWSGLDSSAGDIFAQRYDALGGTAGGEVLVNATTAGQQRHPDVAVRPDGSHVVVWAGPTNVGPTEMGYIHAQRYHASGAPDGGEFQINTVDVPALEHANPSVSYDSGGGFAVVWTLGAFGLYGQRVAADGTLLGTNFRITDQSLARGDVAHLPDDDFLATWADSQNDSILMRRYASDGTPRGGEVAVHTTEVISFWPPTVAATGNGRFAIVWPGLDQVGGFPAGWTLRGQRFGPHGSRIGAEFALADPPGNTIEPSFVIPFVASNAAGQAVIVWEQGEVYGQRATLASAIPALPATWLWLPFAAIAGLGARRLRRPGRPAAARIRSP